VHKTLPNQTRIKPLRDAITVRSLCRRPHLPRNSRRSKAEASRIVVRHFLDWPGNAASRESQGQASTIALTEGYCRDDLRWCDGEELLWAHARMSTNTTRSRGMIVGVTIKKIESRAVDRRFGLQTGCAIKVFSCGEADKGRLWVGLNTRVGGA
jgi:hypothetical protein